jgi:glycosidase
MNIQAIYHRPESNYCFATDGKTIVLRIRFAKGEQICKLSVWYNTKYHIAQQQFKQKMQLIASDTQFDYYKATLRLGDPRLAYLFYFEYDNKPYYFCEDGLVSTYNFNLAYFNSFQFAYINDDDVIQNVGWLNNAVFYQIFVDRFCCSDKAIGIKSKINAEWDELPTPTSFYGGNLDGITEKLDYINGLGATAIYLTPIFKSKSNHKYDTIDFYCIDESFGDKESLKRLVEKAHEKGMRVVLDAVFNHVSHDFARFKDVMKKGKKSKYFDWFVIDGEKIRQDPPNYACFGDCEYMPKLNTCNKEVQNYLVDVMLYWMKECDVDGWRLDVSDEISHGFWRKVREAVKSQKSDSALIGENWHNSESFLRGDQFDSIMNYALTKRMMDFWVDESIDEKQLADRLNSLYMRYSDVTNNMMFNLLDSHDTARFFTKVNKDRNRLLCAIATLVFLPGSFNLYYGTDILLEGEYDPDCRRTFDFSKLQEKDIIDFQISLKEVLKLKRQPAIENGKLKIYSKNDAVVIERASKEQVLRLIVRRKKKIGIGAKPLTEYNKKEDGNADSFVIEGEIL